MATLSTILGLIATKVEALPGGPLAFPGGDWREDLASIGAQADAYQLRALDPDNAPDSEDIEHRR